MHAQSKVTAQKWTDTV